MPISNLDLSQEIFAKELSNVNHDYQLPKVIPAGSLSSNEALNVYKRAYVARLTEALGETYEAVWRVLGDEEFFKVSKLYISRTQSESYNLSDYGNDFPEFLSQQYGHEFSFISDLGRYELIFKRVFHSKQHEPINPNEILNLKDIDSAKFSFGSALSIFEANHSVYELWKLRKEKEIDLDTLPLEQQEKLILYKVDHKIYATKLEHAAHLSMLKGLMLGKTSSEAIEECPHPLSQEIVSSLFQILFKTGVIVGVNYE